jgi:adenosine deaminase
METLPVSRLGHGVRAIEDPTLVAEIAARGLVLEVCPGSNLATGIYPSPEAHPFCALRRAGVAVTLNSDDPPYFATSIGREYDFAARHFGLSEDDLGAITRTAIKAAFVDIDTKAVLLTRLEA